jgi:hypothetical protein
MFISMSNPKPQTSRDRQGEYTTNMEQYGLLAVDSFTKFTHVVPLYRNTARGKYPYKRSSQTWENPNKYIYIYLSLFGSRLLVQL